MSLIPILTESPFLLHYPSQSLTKWSNLLKLTENENEDENENEGETITAFFENQRARWLVAKVLSKWRWNMWKRSPKCNVDLILGEEIPEKFSFYLTDTVNKTVYKFHRNDVARHVVSKLSSLMEGTAHPSPQKITNPWTNAPLTFAQEIAVCQRLLENGMGFCRSPILAAYCASRFDIKKLSTEYAGLLVQNALTSYYSNLTEFNREAICEELITLLKRAGVSIHQARAFDKWFTDTETSTDPSVIALRKEWLSVVRDFVVFKFLQIQIRTNLYGDVRALLERTPIVVTSQMHAQNTFVMNNLMGSLFGNNNISDDDVASALVSMIFPTLHHNQNQNILNSFFMDFAPSTSASASVSFHVIGAGAAPDAPGDSVNDID